MSANLPKARENLLGLRDYLQRSVDTGQRMIKLIDETLPLMVREHKDGRSPQETIDREARRYERNRKNGREEKPKEDDLSIEEKLDYLIKVVSTEDTFHLFLESVKDDLDHKGFLTPKQVRAIEKNYSQRKDWERKRKEWADEARGKTA